MGFRPRASQVEGPWCGRASAGRQRSLPPLTSAHRSVAVESLGLRKGATVSLGMALSCILITKMVPFQLQSEQ